MSVPYYGDFAEDATVKLPFNTYTSDDPAASSTITNLADADIKVSKDGAATPIATDGATVVINLNSITGNHIITIDTSVHSDYATGSEYQVRVEGTTIDGATINAWVGAFSIERAGGVLALVKAGVTLAAGAVTDASLAGNMEIVFETDFGTNYNTDRDAWVTNHTDYIGTIPAAALGADCITSAKIADGAFVADNFAASSLDGKGDWNTTTPPTAAAIVNEWESQSQTDPTGFHVNVMEWLSQPCAAVSVNGVPEVDLTHYAGAAVTGTLITSQDVGLAFESVITTSTTEKEFITATAFAYDDIWNGQPCSVWDVSGTVLATGFLANIRF